ncbi:hypothetical protein L6452_39817 [Arctium lappa]|uniref:Uncharacterized protein n=1 Tax=Arctium lappa TaxID=4217 RepID=A0ACB8XU10_ARCLA|nr:hypothetical protein L6452_39817 [Arctium lappa]
MRTHTALLGTGYDPGLLDPFVLPVFLLTFVRFSSRVLDGPVSAQLRPICGSQVNPLKHGLIASGLVWIAALGFYVDTPYHTKHLRFSDLFIAAAAV